MPERDLDADLALCEAATPGPWFVHARTGAVCHGDPTDDRENFPVDCAEDFDLMATARSALPAWIRRATAAEAEVTQLREAVQRVKDAKAACLEHGKPDELGKLTALLIAVEMMP